MGKNLLIGLLVGYSLYLEVKYNNLVDEYNSLLRMSKRLGEIDQVIIDYYQKKYEDSML